MNGLIMTKSWQNAIKSQSSCMEYDFILIMIRKILYRFSTTNPKVFFDIQIDAKPSGRLIFEVRIIITKAFCRHNTKNS